MITLLYSISHTNLELYSNPAVRQRTVKFAYGCPDIPKCD